MTCPACWTSNCYPHCDPRRKMSALKMVSKTCDLIFCPSCKGYGTEDGRLWAQSQI